VVDTTQSASCADISPRGIAIECFELLTKDWIVQLHSEDRGPAVSRVSHAASSMRPQKQPGRTNRTSVFSST
jgi:hypothetical protein